ncbi:hypothetical protein, partial [Streptomyces sp. NPDC057509]|uniref:hypothetical protein n=1 Tax=Streptomyces sp. NPDC057509 TaxID=3346152 RepID=UPI0036C2C725
APMGLGDQFTDKAQELQQRAKDAMNKDKDEQDHPGVPDRTTAQPQGTRRWLLFSGSRCAASR